MLRMSALRLIAAAVVAAVPAACSGDGTADNAATNPASEVPPVIKERQENFKAIGAAFKSVRGELESDAPDFALIAAKAGDINARAQQIPNDFPALTGIDEGYDTEALAAIWEKPEEFKAAAAKLADESAKLATIAGEGSKDAVAAQAMAIGGACKGCHDQFRLDDEKK
ncbi:MAG: cytochrome c [Porphyrobacter sp.]|nr:cytochrome c [Porphyrobacter sp.]